MRTGIMPFNVAETYGVRLTRRAINLEYPNFKVIGSHSLLLNINHLYGYASDLNAYKLQLQKLPLATIKPKLISIENEEFFKGDIKTYCAQLTAAVEVLPNWELTNGGLTMPHLGYYYWSVTQDNDFFQHNIPTNQKQALIDGLHNETIDNMAYELSVLKGLQIDYVNIHYYMGYPGQVAGIIKMINKVKEVTGKQVISNEGGIYTAGLLQSCVDIAVQTGMRWLILYSGDGSGSALSISKTDFDSVITATS